MGICWVYKSVTTSPVNKQEAMDVLFPILNRKYIFKWWMFHCYVRLTERTILREHDGGCISHKRLRIYEYTEGIHNLKR